MSINFNKTFIDTKSHKKNYKKVAFDPPVSLEVFCDPAKTGVLALFASFPAHSNTRSWRLEIETLLAGLSAVPHSSSTSSYPDSAGAQPASINPETRPRLLLSSRNRPQIINQVGWIQALACSNSSPTNSPRPPRRAPKPLSIANKTHPHSKPSASVPSSRRLRLAPSPLSWLPRRARVRWGWGCAAGAGRGAEEEEDKPRRRRWTTRISPEWTSPGTRPASSPHSSESLSSRLRCDARGGLLSVGMLKTWREGMNWVGRFCGWWELGTG